MISKSVQRARKRTTTQSGGRSFLLANGDSSERFDKSFRSGTIEPCRSDHKNAENLFGCIEIAILFCPAAGVDIFNNQPFGPGGRWGVGGA